MPGLVPGIHAFMRHIEKDVDGRVKPGHDDFFGAAFLVLPGVGPQLAYPLNPAQSNKRLAKDSKDKLMNILPGNMRFGAGQPVRRLEDQMA